MKRQVGYLPDSVGFYGDLTGRQNLRYTARLNGLRATRRRRTIAEALEQVGLGDRADGRADTYSRGMLQRLGIADALIKDPEILILDEPTAAIDPIGVVEILQLLRNLVRERGVTVLLSSHLLTQVQSVCDRVGIFAAGRLIGLGTVAELAARFGSDTGQVEVTFEGEQAEGGSSGSCRSSRRSPRRAVEPGTAGRPWTLSVRPSARGVRSARRCSRPRPAMSLGLTAIRSTEPSLDDIYRAALHEAGLHRAAADSRAGGGRGMTAAEVPVPVPDEARSVPRSGWLVVAGKEFADHVLSVRFFVLLLVLGLAAGIPLSWAPSGSPARIAGERGAGRLLALFIVGPQDVSIFGLDVSVQGFIGLAAPLLGIAFASTR